MTCLRRKMSGLPIALSLSASFMSAITVLGIPAEVYRYGTMFSWFAVSYTIVALVTANVFVPVFYNLGISSTYEVRCKYFVLQLRFLHVLVRTVARTSSIGGLYVCSGGLDILKITKLH